MWWYLWKQKPIGPINLSVSTHPISFPEQKQKMKESIIHLKKTTTKYYYYYIYYLYDKNKRKKL